jgi:hypothetical protein
MGREKPNPDMLRKADGEIFSGEELVRMVDHSLRPRDPEDPFERSYVENAKSIDNARQRAPIDEGHRVILSSI